MAKKLPPIPMQPADVAAKAKAQLPVVRFIKPIVDFESGAVGEFAVSFTFKGLSSLEANLRMLPKICRDAAGVEMSNIAAEIIAEARTKYVPILSGDLQTSGQSDEYVVDGITNPTLTQIAMWFGAEIGPEAKEAGLRETSTYAQIQHEGNFSHARSIAEHGQGSWKYLEIPFLAAAPTVVPRVAKAIEMALVNDGQISDLGAIESGLTAIPDYPGYGT